MKELIFDERLSDGAKVFLQKLWHTYGEECEADNRELSEMVGKTTRRVQQILAELVEEGWIKITYESAKGTITGGRKIKCPNFDKPYEKNFIGEKNETHEKNCAPINVNELELDSNIESSLSSFKDSTYKIDSNYHAESLEKENKREKIKKEKTKEKSPLETLALPKSLNHELWRDFIAYRAEIKKPLKSVGKSRMIHRLLALEAKGININEALEATIRSGWQDVYEPKNKGIPDEFSHLSEQELSEVLKKELKAHYEDSYMVMAIDCKKKFYAFGRRVERIPNRTFGTLHFARD